MARASVATATAAARAVSSACCSKRFTKASIPASQKGKLSGKAQGSKTLQGIALPLGRQDGVAVGILALPIWEDVSQTLSRYRRRHDGGKAGVVRGTQLFVKVVVGDL